MTSGHIDKVKIIVVGDSDGNGGVLPLFGLEILQSIEFTTSNTDLKKVLLHEYKAGTPSEKTYFIELWDVGGSTSHQNSRSIFYNPVHGVILVHDLTNRKSHQNLRKWLGEVMNKDVSKTTNNGYDYDPEQFAGIQIPILVVGTKADLAENLRDNVLSRMSSVAEECGADEINLDCNNTKHLSPGSTNAKPNFKVQFEIQLPKSSYPLRKIQKITLIISTFPRKYRDREKIRETDKEFIYMFGTLFIRLVGVAEKIAHTPTMERRRFFKNSHKCKIE
ncbi:hypothetical protein KUTeg_007027 [Tegillarca granosa]|uniref:Rab-like protein 3 n=1 Tax=Tegillarca granosa TaxID=220873 RepID=A0ABQ9FG86_TEGGR|nr:hypothetical protein KUTeg_007027 [Tegillarca granosa]